MPADIDSGKHTDWQSFLSLIPFVVFLLTGNVVACFCTQEFQVDFLCIAWICTALIVLRIQQLIENYSYGSYPYKPTVCLALLIAVVVSPWIWLHLAGYPLQMLAHFGLIPRTTSTWVCGFTLSATATSLAFVSPMIEGWYEILRGSCSFDGVRFRDPKPSFISQIYLLAIFGGIMLAPIDAFGEKVMTGSFHLDTLSIIAGFFATLLSLIWLLVQLERIRQKQVIRSEEQWSPIDRNLILNANRPLRETMETTCLKQRRIQIYPL
jgi:hypothetical protein